MVKDPKFSMILEHLQLINQLRISKFKKQIQILKKLKKKKNHQKKNIKI